MLVSEFAEELVVMATTIESSLRLFLATIKLAPNMTRGSSSSSTMSQTRVMVLKTPHTLIIRKYVVHVPLL